MNTIATLAASLLLLMFPLVSNAQLLLDTKLNGSPKDIAQMTWDDERAFHLDVFFDQWKKSVQQSISQDNEGVADSEIGDPTPGHIIFNGKEFYSWAVNYLSAAQDREIDSEVVKKSQHIKSKQIVLPGGGVCALYIYDKSLQKVASIKINLPEAQHQTWCNSIQGLGAAGKGRDGVLVALSYYLTTGDPLAHKISDIGNGWKYMTVFIRFAEQDGKLVLTQDDSCFGNPNRLEDIPSARKALDRCGVR